MVIAEKTDAAFRTAVDNSVRNMKRSVLDILDYQEALLPDELKNDKRVQTVFQMLKRRIHNDGSNVYHQVIAAWEIVKADGEIPPFGRTDEEMRGTQWRSGGAPVVQDRRTKVPNGSHS